MDDSLLIAAAGIAGGYFALDKAGVFDKDPDPDCNAAKELAAKLNPSPDKLTDHSAVARAAAMAEYGCKYFQAIKTNAKTNLIISLIQQAASFYFADKQHDVAKQAQNRFDEIWHNQKDKSDKFFAHWWDNGRPIEIAMLNEARAREQDGYQVDYETAMQRAVTTARAEFSWAREKVRRETPIHCVGASRTALRQLRIAEAKAVVYATNSAVRFEEDRKHQRESQYREEVYKWTALFQGRISDSLNALRTAQQAAAAASAIDPYQGWAQSIGNLSNIGVGIARMNTAEFGALNAGAIPSFISSGW